MNYMNITYIKNNLIKRFLGFKIYFNKSIQELGKFLSEKFFAGARWFILARDKMKDLKTTNF
jgi:hypothetical protein